MAMKLNKGVGGSVMPADAKRWIQNYLDKNPGDIECIFYGSDIINSILEQPDCVGIRIYFALDDKGAKQLLLVGSREDASNIWPKELGGADDNGIVGDNGWPCPPACVGP